MRNSHIRSRLTPLVVLACALAGEAGGNHLTIEPVEDHPGHTRFAIVFHPSPEPLSGLQFELEYGSASVSMFVFPGTATRESQKNVYVSDLTPTRKKFLIVGLNQLPIQAGEMVTFLVGVDPGIDVDELALQISSAKAVYGNGAVAPLEAEETTVPLRAGSDPPAPLDVVNAASLAPSPLSSNTILTLLGRSIGPSQAATPETGPAADDLAGTRVLIHGVAAQLLYAGPDQINLVAPPGVAGLDTAQIVVTRQSVPVVHGTLPVAGADPALFTLTGGGIGQAAALNQDGSVNEPLNPATRGSVVALFATGLGTTETAGADGIAVAQLPVSVSIGGIEAAVEYAGAAPGLVMGVFQVNCRVPEDLEPAPAVEVRVTAGADTSPAGVTLALK